MSTLKLIRWLALAIFAAGAAYLAAIYPALPDRIATHLDFYGNPDGWGSKQSFALIMCGVFGGINLLMLVVVPLLMRIVPGSMMNFPTRRMKEYWNATPERINTVKRRTLSILPVTLVPLNLLFVLIVQFTYQGHMSDPVVRVPFMPAMLGSLALVLLSNAGIAAWLFWSLRVPRECGE